MRAPRNNSKFNSNFPEDFLIDFGLGSTKYTNSFFWIFTKKALLRFHAPIAYRDLDGNEGAEHYNQKRRIHNYIYEQYYLNNECKFFVTTELQQVNKPFKTRTDGAEKMFYKLDICVIREKDHQIFDIEIDGEEHRKSNERLLKDKVRDELLEFRYGIYTYRQERDEPINYKKIDEFLQKPTKEYTRNRRIGGQKLIKPTK